MVLALAAGMVLTQTQGPVANGSSTIRGVDAARATGSDVPQGELHSAAPRAARDRLSAKQAPGKPTPAAPGKAPKAARTQERPSAPASASPSAPPSSKVLTYDFQLQPNYYYCGPAATRIVLSAQGHTLSQDEIAKELHTTTGGTDSAEDATRALNNVIGGNRYQTRSMGGSATQAQIDQLQADAVRAIGDGRAVVANVVGSVTDMSGSWHGYGGGHYVAVVGYRDDGRTVKIADPANSNGDGTYWVDTAKMARWMVNRGYSF